jgi:hypothetical protein
MGRAIQDLELKKCAIFCTVLRNFVPLRSNHVAGCAELAPCTSVSTQDANLKVGPYKSCPPARSNA